VRRIITGSGCSIEGEVGLNTRRKEGEEKERQRTGGRRGGTRWESRQTAHSMWNRCCLEDVVLGWMYWIDGGDDLAHVGISWKGLGWWLEGRTRESGAKAFRGKGRSHSCFGI